MLPVDPQHAVPLASEFQKDTAFHRSLHSYPHLDTDTCIGKRQSHAHLTNSRYTSHAVHCVAPRNATSNSVSGIIQSKSSNFNDIWKHLTTAVHVTCMHSATALYFDWSEIYVFPKTRTAISSKWLNINS